jgi:antitoxin (DNA-binding transcriptional repressor) of toxin-antitoxin stability system
MKYVSVRDLSTKPRTVWKKIKEDDVVVTSNGKPIALMYGVTEETLEEQIRAVRRSRALLALEDMQKEAAKRDLDRLSDADIEAEVQAVRKDRAA